MPWTGASTEVFYAESGRELARCFVHLADLDSGIFERLGCYEAALWRQVNTCSGVRRAAAIGERRIAGKGRLWGSADDDRADEP